MRFSQVNFIPFLSFCPGIDTIMSMEIYLHIFFPPNVFFLYKIKILLTFKMDRNDTKMICIFVLTSWFYQLRFCIIVNCVTSRIYCVKLRFFFSTFSVLRVDKLCSVYSKLYLIQSNKGFFLCSLSLPLSPLLLFFLVLDKANTQE